MNFKDKIEFSAQAEALYKPLMKKMIMQWKDKYDSGTIRECFCFWVLTHNHQKILELVNKRKHRKLKVQKLKTELETLKAEKLIADPLQDMSEEAFKI